MARIWTSLILPCLALSCEAQAQIWPRSDAEELLHVAEQVGADGLDPADYDVKALRADVARGDAGSWSGRATAMFLHLAGDFSNGHLRDRRAVAWHIAGPELDDAAARALLAEALANRQVGRVLARLPPQHRQYRSLKAALAVTPARDKAAIERLRANLERWRWMPRELGSRYLLVNVPAFTVSLVEGGRVVERRRVIVGKRATPTPQFAATISGLVVNPWWDVPPSIVRESVGQLLRAHPAQARARGFVSVGGRVRQAPGPGNALGLVKLVMPNPFRVYLHDTPTKQLFDEEVRAFSHGCVRVEQPEALASYVLRGDPDWDQPRIVEAMHRGVERAVKLRAPIPVHIVYFTAWVDAGGGIQFRPDIYGYDR